MCEGVKKIFIWGYFFIIIILLIKKGDFEKKCIKVMFLYKKVKKKDKNGSFIDKKVKKKRKMGD